MGLFKKTVVSLALLGMIVPQTLLAGAPRTPQSTVQRAMDVALTSGGTLHGQVVNAQGEAVEGAVVSIRQNQQEVARRVTDNKGQFSATNLKGGMYQIAAGTTQVTYRLWTENTAPPIANSQALLVSGSEVVRGQFGGMDVVDLTILGAAITGVTLSAVNLSETNDIKDTLENQSP